MRGVLPLSISIALVALVALPVSAQVPKGQAPEATPSAAAAVDVAPDFVIGAEDILQISVWREKDMSVEGMVVRPDGKISLPLIGEIHAQGKTVMQLTADVTAAASKYVQDPTVDVIVRQINSRKVSITGEVGKTGQYPLLSHMTVVDLISAAGGVQEYAKKKNIQIVRTVKGKKVSLPFNYQDFLKGKPKALEQNIELQPGDIVTVP